MRLFMSSCTFVRGVVEMVARAWDDVIRVGEREGSRLCVLFVKL